MMMASCPIISWHIDGETIETVKEDFIFEGSKIIKDGENPAMKLKDTCSLE